MKVLDDVYQSFTNVIEDYSAKHGLTVQDKEKLIKMATNVFLEKKAAYFLEQKLENYTKSLNMLLDCTLNVDPCDHSNDSLNFLYVKRLKRLTTNE